MDIESGSKRLELGPKGEVVQRLLPHGYRLFFGHSAMILNT
jgi:hypothetical protein